MIYISHRGNLSAPNPKKENTKAYILEAIHQGFDVEIDVWYIDGRYLLGHDEPKEEVFEHFLCSNNLWCHAKNHQALERMLGNSFIHCFWHDKDKYTLTSKRYIWMYPCEIPINKTIYVVPEFCNPDISDIKMRIKDCYGVCSDFVERLKNE